MWEATPLRQSQCGLSQCLPRSFENCRSQATLAPKADSWGLAGKPRTCTPKKPPCECLAARGNFSLQL